MAFTCKLIVTTPEEWAADVKAYLDGETITTLHQSQGVLVGHKIYHLVVFE